MKKICIIGGGFYGAAVSLFLNSKNKYDITLLEKEPYLCKRASYRNQARVHNGYHYPRSFSTAYRSHYNFKSFCNKWDSFLSKEFTQYYAISKINSKINYSQYEKFCHREGIPLKEAKLEIYKLFNTLT